MYSASDARALRARASVTGVVMPGRNCFDKVLFERGCFSGCV